MRIFYTAIFALTFSSSLFAETKPINIYEMEQTKYAQEVYYRQYNIMCIDGYRWLVYNGGMAQMKENYKGKYRHMECPIEKP